MICPNHPLVCDAYSRFGSAGDPLMWYISQPAKWGPLTSHFSRLPSAVRTNAPLRVPTRTLTLLISSLPSHIFGYSRLDDGSLQPTTAADAMFSKERSGVVGSESAAAHRAGKSPARPTRQSQLEERTTNPTCEPWSLLRRQDSRSAGFRRES